MKDLNGKPALVVNRAQCLNCGDVLISKHRHDYVSCCCGSLSLDGGLDYLKRSYINAGDVLELSLYTDSPWEEIRCNVFRGSRGKNGDKPLTWRSLSEIDEEYLKSLVEYKERYTETKDIHYWAYCKERDYRDELQKESLK